MSITAAEFMSSAPAPMGGNTPWASRYASELRRVVTEQANGSARNVQRHLGPSELGVPCDRQVVGKLARHPVTNHVVDPWASVIGTAVHAWLAEAFAGDNLKHDWRGPLAQARANLVAGHDDGLREYVWLDDGSTRWVPERRVTPHPEHPGTGDLYDHLEFAVVDHKVLGESSLNKVKSTNGPPIKYVVQLMLYGRGFRLMGLPVRRIALAAYPRTSHTLDGLYVWEQASGPQDDAFLAHVFALTDRRKQLAQQVISGRLSLNDIATAPDDDECFFCPFYRPQSAKDGGPGCPGPRKSKSA